VTVVAQAAREPGVRWRDVAFDERGTLWALSDGEYPLRTGRLDSIGRIHWAYVSTQVDLAGAVELLPLTWQAPAIGVWNPRSGRLAIVEHSGRTLENRPLPIAQSNVNSSLLSDGFIRPFRTHAWAGRVLLPWIRADIMREADLWYTDLVVGDLDRRIFRSLVDLDAGIPTAAVARLRRMTWPSVPYWAGCGENVTWYNPITGQIAWIGLDGAEKARQSVSSAGTRLHSRDLRIISRRRERGLPSRGGGPEQAPNARSTTDAKYQALRNAVGPRAPAFVDLYCDSRNRAWLQPFDADESPPGGSNSWTVIEPTGRVARLDLPTGFSPRSHSGDVVAGIQLDSTGEAIVVLVRLDAPVLVAASRP
jgi:hypothetical protein